MRITPLELRGIALRFGRKLVLDGVDLEVAGGEAVALMGRNGAGKTTLMGIAAGLTQPDAGERRFGGRQVADVDLEIRARLALVTHRPQVHVGLTARENLELHARLRRAAGHDAVACGEALARFGLSEPADRPVSTFSRGMAQRLALARALSARPQLLLLDEPFTALDREGRALLVDALADERARGVGVLLCSHEVEVVAALADRVLLLSRGRIVASVAREGDAAGFARAIDARMTD